jgi:hypothetical protein
MNDRIGGKPDFLEKKPLIATLYLGRLVD